MIFLLGRLESCVNHKITKIGSQVFEGEIHVTYRLIIMKYVGISTFFCDFFFNFVDQPLENSPHVELHINFLKVLHQLLSERVVGRLGAIPSLLL